MHLKAPRTNLLIRRKTWIVLATVAGLATPLMSSWVYVGEGWEALSVRYVLHDDAFYYLKLADSLANTGTSSFDGIHATNGYHPLWLLLTTGLRGTGPGAGGRL